MTHHPIAQALYYCIVAIVPTPQPRKPQTCNNINTTDKHPCSERTRDPSKQAAADLRLRPRCYLGRLEGHPVPIIIDCCQTVNI
jgi:hypothetical protein